MLDLRRLRLLRELQIRGTLSGVAAALNQSPSSVSQQLAQLEREVGVALLRKSGRRVVLTAQAELLVEHVSAVLERLELAESELSASFSTATGTVRLAVFQSAALALLPHALSILAREHPSLRVEVTQREPESALYDTWASDFDLVVAEQYPGHAAPHHQGLDRVHLTGDRISLAVARGSTITSLANAARTPWVMEPRGAASRHWAEQACRQAGFEPDVRFETADLQAHIRFVESGNAVALLPDLVWTARDITATLIPLAGDPRRTIFTAVRRATVRSPGVIACRGALQRTAAQLSP
ncbi:LysR family transcriptional regulator [Salinibacterium hongtaonis]|uniref:LysR family transcriptional regulator n=1 Tax=Homoserinimonas hongtaonis TaxID=2079791 RepID=UPI000D3ABA86|nr:LysR family transcriptional regulator [Salinibacterium hongtaonis]AWB89268.1 LysR family transcriptional regulator [Salinibacterium hongtaonis]